MSQKTSNLWLACCKGLALTREWILIFLDINVTDKVKAKFHNAILVADSSEAGRRQVRSWSQTQLLASCRPNSGSLHVCDQLRTCLRPG